MNESRIYTIVKLAATVVTLIMGVGALTAAIAGAWPISEREAIRRDNELEQRLEKRIDVKYAERLERFENAINRLQAQGDSNTKVLRAACYAAGGKQKDCDP